MVEISRLRQLRAFARNDKGRHDYGPFARNDNGRASDHERSSELKAFMSSKTMPHNRPPMGHASQKSNCAYECVGTKSMTRPAMVAMIMMQPQIAPMRLSVACVWEKLAPSGLVGQGCRLDLVRLQRSSSVQSNIWHMRRSLSISGYDFSDSHLVTDCPAHARVAWPAAPGSCCVLRANAGGFLESSCHSFALGAIASPNLPSGKVTFYQPRDAFCRVFEDPAGCNPRSQPRKP